ncbi:MAG: amidohydrolase family protein [Bryobacteraceae bacterium]
MKTLVRILAVPVLVVAMFVACNKKATKTEGTAAGGKVVKYGVEVKAGPMDSILLKDYAPKTSLVVPETFVPRARFPVIDVHSHTFMSTIRRPEDVDAWVKTMDATGIETTVVFTDAVGAEFDKQAGLYLKRHPTRFQLWCGLDTTGIDKPDYPARAAAELERCYKKGARGVGELSDKGWGFGGSEKNALPRNKRLHLDDLRLELVWRKCVELKLPINIHVADHPSCWQPLGPNQERTADFQAFNMIGKDVPQYSELLDKRDNLLSQHPKNVFIFCHLSNQGNDTAALAKLLDRFPNLYLDISARDYEIGRQPRTAARFIEKYKDRILFGTDMGREKAMYQNWWRLLETGDEFMQGRVWWRQYGLELPAPVLKALYRENALRLLNWKKVG